MKIVIREIKRNAWQNSMFKAIDSLPHVNYYININQQISNPTSFNNHRVFDIIERALRKGNE